MRRVLILAVLALALPLMAYADSSIDVSNSGGTITGNASGLSLTGSTLWKFGSTHGSNLGTVSFTTGAFNSGNAQNGGTLAAGGSFNITGNGTNGVPNGVIFNGSFSSDATWTLVTLANGGRRAKPEFVDVERVEGRVRRGLQIPRLRERAHACLRELRRSRAVDHVDADARHRVGAEQREAQRLGDRRH